MLSPPISRRALLAGLGAGPLIPARAASARPLNVVMFMSDDHGAWANGFGGCAGMATPNLDALARSGLKFTNAFAATPVCSPSRMTWLTGRMPSTHGVQDWLVPRDSFGPQSRRWLEGHPAWSEALAASGYTLGMCGKWHMGLDDTAQAGFSFWASVPGGGGPYRDAEFAANGRKVLKPGFKEDAIGDFALEFLQQAHRSPFALLMPFYAPHTPYDYQPEQDRAPYASSGFECFPDEPVHPWQNRGLRKHHGNRDSKLAYSALVTAMDRNVGRVVRRLEELGVRENTLIVFTADQGWNAGHHGVWGKGNGTVPFNMYEESIRVPLIWNLPGRIRSGASAAPVSNYDFKLTLLDYLGIASPRDPKCPGQSYAPLLRGRGAPRERALFFEYSYVRAIRTARWKYVQRAGEHPSELFDLASDPGERRNVLDEPRGRAASASLKRELDGFFRRLGAPPLDDWRSTTRQQIPA
jgi:arylsulfatase A-like enzyme